MKASLAIACLLAAGSAAAAPARKTAPDKFTRAASELFRGATKAEDAGDLKRAIKLYEQSLQLAVHPNTVYNLAAVYERSGEVDKAIIEYEIYLALSPTASDASAVRATITALEKRPATLAFTIAQDFDPADAYFIVDGVISKRPGQLAKKPFKLTLPAGQHTLDVVTAVGYEGSSAVYWPGGTYNERLDVTTPLVGNVAVNIFGGDLKVGKAERGTGRFTVPPGKQKLTVYDRDLECPPISIDAPANDDTLYLFVKIKATKSPMGGDRKPCRAYEVTQQRLAF